MNIEDKNLDDILEIAARHMRESPIAAGPSTELIDRTVSGMRRARRQKRPWSALSLMAASLLLIIGAAGWFVTRGSGEIAFADVMQQVLQTRSFQATITQVGDEHEPHESARLSVKGPCGRFDTDDGLIIIDDDKTGNAITLDTKSRVACRSSQPINDLNFYAELRQIAAQIPKSIGKRKFGDHILNGFSGTVTFMGKSGVWATVWVDPQTKLPVRLELSPKADGPPMTVMDDLKFDVPLDGSMFDMALPQGYELRAVLPARAPRPLPRQETSSPTTTFTVEIPLPLTPGPAPTTQELGKFVLKPGVGIGELKFGASREQIVRALGQPQGARRAADCEELQYATAGITLEIDARLGLRAILADGPSIVNAPKFRPFAGSSDNGVRIGSTRAEIEAAYGKDYIVVGVEVKNHPEIHRTQMAYGRLGLLAFVDTMADHCVGLALVPPWGTPPAATKASTVPAR